MQNEFLRLQSLLKKTIVFITHDFDEAIRLADRIAIMRDGSVVQVGTPEELVVSPADAYVAEFTREAPRAKILSARAVMRPLERRDATSPGTVPAASRIIEIAAHASSSRIARFAVVDETGSADRHRRPGRR